MTYIVTPDRYSVKQLLAAHKFFSSNLDVLWVSEQNRWTCAYRTAYEWFDWFRDKLTLKIASHLPKRGKGNKSLRRRGMSVEHYCPHDKSKYILPAGLKAYCWCGVKS